ncbi:MAG: ATP-dependent helicase HrpB, partial [Desulfobacterales bacterium]|nr:ATP-dependent helicase HrpB [Desulfobacterales bacterium]
MKKRKLPIDEILPGLAKELASHASVVLQAPPGAGKTTGVPLALLDAPFLKGKKIVMLEPRRLAARNAARRMAQTLGEKVGETVGYRIRMEKKISPKTRIEVVTEGILTRIIQNDPELNAFGLIIFDEFHERNISSDLGLALCLESQAALRDDLKILVMSATLDAQPVAELLDGAPILTSEGRSFPIETRYLGLTSPHAPKREVEAACTRAVIRAFQEDVGDILVFLPGAGEIRRVQKRLQTTLGEKALICPLFGALSQKEQDAAISPSLGSHRKIVLATAIAETSLTLHGIRIVVDSGLMRVHRFSPGSGMGKLETIPVSKASADQRRGRAGRTEPGVCYRLWRREETPMLQPFTAPEISVADLAPLALELALWGVSRAEELSWLTLPPPSALKQANGLLQSLGALDQSFRITAHGKAMAKAGIHPRLAHMVLMGKAKGKGAEASLLSVILTEKLSRAMGGEKDLASIMEDLLGNKKTAPHLFKLAREIAGRFGIKGEPTCTRSAGWLVSLAFPDRIAKKRRKGSQEYLMASGGGAFFDKPCPLSAEELIAIADLDGDKTRSRIYLAAPLREEEIFELHGSRIKEEESVIWNNALARVEALFKERLGAITLKERNITPSPEAIT